MEWLQKILNNAVYEEDGKLDVDATMKKINDEAFKHVVPKVQYNSKVEELKTANDTIDNLKKNNAGNENLQKEVEKYKDDIEALKESHKKEVDGIRVSAAITKALSEAKAKYPELMESKFDKDKLKITEDGKVEGVSEQLKEIREAYKDMFDEKPAVSGKNPNNPASTVSGNATFDAIVKNADTMTAEEVASQFAAMEK